MEEKKEYKIGTLTVKNRIFLAPMLEPNDIAFRLLCKKAGAGLTYTGMFSPQSHKELITDDQPAVQLFGATNKGFRDFIKKNDHRVQLWDFNLGCPSTLSRKLGHGAFMHKDFENIEKILKTMRRNTKKPISIKLRKSPQALQVAKLAEPYVDAIGIHARTLQQGYGGEADYEFALKLRDSVNVPIIYSGNIDEKNIEQILKDFPFVFIGRKSTGDPGIFSRLQGEEINFDFKEYLKLAKKYNLPFRQIKYQGMTFSRGHPQAKHIRRALMKAKTLKEIEEAWQTHKYPKALRVTCSGK
jgi:tRNA-dihydrouridine synthase B